MGHEVDMALMRRGALFAGALFAGVLFGPQQQEAVAAQPEYHGGRWRDVTYEEVSERWELLGLRLQPSSRLSTRQEDTHAPGILAKDEITGTPDISMPLVLRGVTAHMPKVDAALAGLLEKRDTEQHAAMLQRRRNEEYLLLLMLAEIDAEMD